MPFNWYIFQFIMFTSFYRILNDVDIYIPGGQGFKRPFKIQKWANTKKKLLETRCVGEDSL